MFLKSLKNILYIFVLISVNGCNEKAAQASKPPNILFILSDDHTSNAWGVYGGILEEYVQNTHIKRLAAQGALLENSFCTNSICSPSRASILTGQYSHKNKVYTLNEPLPRSHPNIAQTLQAAGYHTAIIGKWHLNGKPEGFDFFKVLPGQGKYWDPVFKTNDQWVDGHDGSHGVQIKGFSTDIIADLSISHLKERDPSKPFLLFTHFKATHEPFDYPKEFASLYKDIDIPEPASLLDFGPKTSGRTFEGQKLEKLAERWERATNEPDSYWTSYPGLPYELEGLDSIEKRKRIYQKLVKDFMRSGAAIDKNIGKILDYLEESGLAENTVVIYAADQGYFLGEHGFFDKRLIYEESLRMPFVIRYPKEIKAGTRIKEMILNIDFAPLMADYAGIEKPTYMQGKSFRALLNGKKTLRWRNEIYYRYWLHHPDRPAHFGIRNERYKLAYFYGKGLNKKGVHPTQTKPEWEFYDLQEDPKENYNAIANPKYKELIKNMKTALIKLREQYGDKDPDHPELQLAISQEP
ncbi:MAG: sulfatase [Flavobacteriaceae bacterium]